MKHLDLFSGIGGFALAVDRVFPGTEHIFCDNNEFCQQVLKHHYPNAKIFTDIRAITADTYGSRCVHGESEIEPAKGHDKTQRESIPSSDAPFILTGGFPCQPFSQAGRRKGTDDDRFLWPEMLRVIRLTEPEWVIAENVRGILTIEQGVVFEQVCLDLEASGYEVQPFVIPAVAVNAPHRRDRVWFVAHRTGERLEERPRQSISSQRYNSDAPNPRQQRRFKGNEQRMETDTSERTARPTNHKRQGKNALERGSWERNWTEVATEFCRMDDGLPVELDGFELSKSANRRERLKSLGNAIVPKVAEQILKAILNSIKNQ